EERAGRAFEGFFAQSERRAEGLGARRVAYARRARAAEGGENFFGVGVALLVCEAAERELDFSVGQDVGHAKARAFAAAESMRLGARDEADPFFIDDREEADARLLPPRFAGHPRVEIDLRFFAQHFADAHRARETPAAIDEEPDRVALAATHLPR